MIRQKEFVRVIVETYYGSTGITTLHIDAEHITYPSFLKGFSYTDLTKYFEFEEITNFLTAAFKQGPADFPTFHTFITRSFFVYNIVFIGTKTKIKEAVISGPLIVPCPEDKVPDHIFFSHSLDFRQKQEFKSVLNQVPLASLERVDYLGRLLFALCKSNVRFLSGEQQFQGRKIKNTNKGLDQLLSIGFDEDKGNQYELKYKFFKEVKENIVRGNEKGIKSLLKKSGHLLWQTPAQNENAYSLKINCIFVGCLSCIFAVEGNAPYDRMMVLLERFMDKITKLNSPEEIIVQGIEIIKVFTHAVSVLTYKKYSLHVNRALQYIRIHYAEPITLKQLAEYLNLNPSYLSSQINKETQLSLTDNIHKIRIEQSKHLLINTNCAVKEIADAVGYNYQNYFNAVFKSTVGMTPLEFREKSGKLSV